MARLAQPFFCHLTDDGLLSDGTNHLADVDGSVTPVPFFRGPTTGYWKVARLIVVISDTGGLGAEEYGNISTLTNGVTVKIHQGGVTGPVELDLMDGDAVRSSVDWSRYCYDVTDHTFGSGDNFIAVRWTFNNTGGPLLLSAHSNDVLVATIQDNLVGLVKHTFMLQGKQVAELD